jgi:hypothetical protein
VLQNVNDIIKRVGVLVDDPGNTRFSPAYLIPHIDQVYEEMDVDLELLGMQYVEHIAIVNVNANVTDLTYMLANGQPLASMKLPSWMKWKLQGQPDTSYVRSAYVDELAEVALSSQGALQFTFQQGALQVTPSAVALTLKIGYEAVSTNIYDPAQGVIRGTAHILAVRVAAYVASLKGGMGSLQKMLDAKADRTWTAFCKLVTKKNQSKQIVAGLLHGRSYSSGMPQIQAPSSSTEW